MLDLTAGPCVAKRLAGCGSGTEYLAVTPWGDLYPCHQFVGNEKFLLGNVDTGIVNTETRDEFKLLQCICKRKHARTALQDFTAAVDVVQMPIISVVLLTAHMRSAARCRKRGSNVPS